jgi:hypothetical protein
VIDKREISSEPLACVAQSWGGDRMQDQSDFDPLSFVLQPENSKHGFVKRTGSLDDIIWM